jgi:hypothetical protein
VPRCRVYSDLPTARGQPTRHEREGAGVSSPIRDFREHVFSETHSHKTSTSESHVPPRRVRKGIDRVRAYRRSRSQQGVAEALSASGSQIYDRHVWIQLLHGLQVRRALRLIRVAGGRPIHCSTGSVTQPPAVSRLTVFHVPEQDELTGVVGQTASPRLSECTDFLTNYNPLSTEGCSSLHLSHHI